MYTSNNPTHHEQTVVAQRVAGDGGEIVLMLLNAAALAPPAAQTPRQAEVPAGGHGVRAVREPPQGDVDGGPQVAQRHTV